MELMRSDNAIKTDVYKFIKNSVLMEEVTGTLSKTKRPHNSTDEDVIISILSNVGTQNQTATLNVNIYVTDYDIDGQYEENTERLNYLSQKAWDTLEAILTDDYAIHAVSQRVYPSEAGEHIINTQIEYKILND